jgi:hypothetical protein
MNKESHKAQKDWDELWRDERDFDVNAFLQQEDL